MEGIQTATTLEDHLQLIDVVNNHLGEDRALKIQELQTALDEFIQDDPDECEKFSFYGVEVIDRD